jgi:hypothetical protein
MRSGSKARYILNPALDGDEWPVSCFRRFIPEERLLILCLNILCLDHNAEDVEIE